MSYDPSTVAFIDTETTGLDPELRLIWEYAVIVDDTEHVWQARLPDCGCLDPACPYRSLGTYNVDEWVLENTDVVRRYDSANAMHPDDAALLFANLTRGRHLVGACPWFDAERIHRQLLRHPSDDRTLPWHYHLIDVETLIVGWVQGLSKAGASPPLPWDSEDLSRYVGVDPDQFDRHTALGDARWAKAMFEAVMGGPA
jgi:hypothetical protein